VVRALGSHKARSAETIGKRVVVYTSPMRWLWVLVSCVCAGLSVSAQQSGPWEMQQSGTAAGLRGIDSVDGKTAWASGTGGTVLKTLDGGSHWDKCAIPDAASDGASLDLRGVQAFDARTAIVMASGAGAKSRLYKTTDGCRTWTLMFANPDAPNGFFDAFWFNGARGIVVGDPVNGRFAVFLTDKDGREWKRDPRAGLALGKRDLGAFAASNSAVAIGNGLFTRAFATGGKSGSFFFSRPFTAEEDKVGLLEKALRKQPPWKSSQIPIGSGTESSGTFSVAYRYPVTIGICAECTFNDNSIFIAVGGDYTKPNGTDRTAAWSADGGATWIAATSSPHGYRSAVQWSDPMKAWIAVGTNGSDISRDDGKNWRPLDDGNWNALSLPFAVGTDGRIARLDAAAIPKK
jgi:photosystem II stability/assembly factor-like uncharacterized protein